MSLPASSSPQSSSATSKGVFVVVSMRKRFTQCASSKWTDPAMMPSPASGAQAIFAMSRYSATAFSRTRRPGLVARSSATAIEDSSEAGADASRSRSRSAISAVSRRYSEPSPLALAYAAAFRVARDARAWLGFAPAKRSYAVSLSASGVNSLAQKYEQLLRDGFEDAEAALQALDALRTRLPVPQRVVRFVRGSEFEDVEEEEDAAQNRRTSFPRARTFSSGGADDDESLKFAPEAADDFLTDAAPLGQGMDDSALFACRDGGKLFFTSSCRVAEQCAYAGRGAPDADASRPAIVARTILYQKLDGARDIALEQGDEIWAATIDGRDYFNVVMADDTDPVSYTHLTLPTKA